MISPSFHNDYLFPGNLALIGIIDRSNDQQVELVPLKTALPNEIQRDVECCIIGHPIKPEDLKTCLPQGPYDGNTGDLIRESFCHFCYLVKSEGTINNFDDNIIETKCLTAKGMSGSPILIKSGTELKYIGLHNWRPSFTVSARHKTDIRAFRKIPNTRSIYSDPAYSDKL